VAASPRPVRKRIGMSAADRRFVPLGGRTIYEGRIVTLRIERFRYPDGEEVEREIVRHQGAVAAVVHDETDLFLVRQPRETVGDPDFLEIPAGRLDVEGETAVDAARRELAEEIGKAADTWEPIAEFVSSVGVMDETIHLFYATGVSDAHAEAEHNERIEIVRWPLADLDGAIAATRDAKTLIGLLWLKARG
jgi:8-oxo-dGTP pyrophosphatase MutT (NUDIX family)